MHEEVYGVSFAVKILKNINVETTLVVWNFTGQERYKTVQPHYMKGVSGILLLFDLTRLDTFVKLQDWLEFIHRHDSDPNIPIFLIGTKSDLFHLKDVSDTGIENFVNTNKLQGYYEVSFKTGLNVEFVIKKMSELIFQTRINRQKLSTKFKLTRKYPDRPIIMEEEEEKVREEFLLTAKTIFNMTFEDFLARIKSLEPHLNRIQKSQDYSKADMVKKKLEMISKELITQNRKIELLLQNPPVPVPTYLKLDLSKEWKKMTDKLRYHMFVFKDVFNFMAKSK